MERKYYDSLSINNKFKFHNLQLSCMQNSELQALKLGKLCEPHEI